MRSPRDTAHGLPSALPMGTPDAAYHLAMRGRPLPVGFLFRYDGPPPPLDAVRARVAERAHAIPALRYRVAGEGKVFRRVDRIAVEQHVHEFRPTEHDTDGPGAGRLMLTRPMSAAGRPPWEVWLVHGPDGGHTLCYRTDHTLQDGVGAAHTARALLDDHPEGGGPAPHHRSRPTARGLAGAFGDVAASCRPATAKPAFDVPGSGRLTVCHADVPLARLRAVGRAHGATVNDVYLAALSHAVRSWHLKATGSPHPPVPVAVPMSVRAPGEELAPGNRMVVARLQLPCDEASPRRALARVAARTARLRASRRRDALSLLLAATPRAIGARLGTRMVNGAVVAAPTSSVNFGDALVHQGAVARRAVMLTGLAAGIRCMTTLTSQHDAACLTVVHDEALATADELPDLWLAALLELEQT
ncbi:diacylglycerol O-acyltransferase [Streptomyces sp. LBL]|uniref:wax ester/triacylglycerol synthase domain-containing protein n=1 Tax=Streptomyces sp. LBL TaxID=2940562 RepID=UPI00247596D8|nr:wax ester/triacylglycerol synthase domain-containing protein [Streptomyces sp. LBL]MDH6623273.1 diacylglycerol O-acyltransferase [Streptomyces sp. LBL]